MVGVPVAGRPTGLPEGGPRVGNPPQGPCESRHPSCGRYLCLSVFICGSPNIHIHPPYPRRSPDLWNPVLRNAGRQELCVNDVDGPKEETRRAGRWRPHFPLRALRGLTQSRLLSPLPVLPSLDERSETFICVHRCPSVVPFLTMGYSTTDRRS